MMFRTMRRAAQQLTEAETAAILASATSGVLALSGDNGYPYAVPLSFVYSKGVLYFHCATQGHKLDAIRRSPKASFCVIAQDDVLPEQYTTRYRSAVAFGAVRLVEQADEKRAALGMIARKYAPDDSADHQKGLIDQSLPRLAVLALDIEHMTGKQGKALL